MRPMVAFLAVGLVSLPLDARAPVSALAVSRLTGADWSTVAAPVAGPSRAIGSFGSGCLAGAVPLPDHGNGYQQVDASRQRNFGHRRLIDFVESLGQAVAQEHQGVLLVGDLAQPRGGPMPAGHVSHQDGLDVDIPYQFDRPGWTAAQRDLAARLSVVDPASERLDPALWGERQISLVKLAASNPRVSRVFIAATVKRDLCRRRWPDRGWLRTLRPWPRHEDHLHVRLFCPADSPACIDQPPLSGDDGCSDAVLLPALARDRAERQRPSPPPSRHLPAACAAILAAPGQGAAPPSHSTAGD
jgi:penicillin-insensitive murein endopeptidase